MCRKYAKQVPRKLYSQPVKFFFVQESFPQLPGTIYASESLKKNGFKGDNKVNDSKFSNNYLLYSVKIFHYEMHYH